MVRSRTKVGISKHGDLVSTGTNYAVDDITLWRNKLYKAKQATTGELPTDNDYWEEAGKFQTDVNNFLWGRYLKQVIAWHIQHTNVVYHAIRQTGLNVGKASGSNIEPIDASSLAAFKAEIGYDFNDYLLTMDKYLRDNKASFPLYKPNKIGLLDGKTPVGKARKDYGFSFG